MRPTANGVGVSPEDIKIVRRLGGRGEKSCGLWRDTRKVRTGSHAVVEIHFPSARDVPRQSDGDAYRPRGRLPGQQ